MTCGQKMKIYIVIVKIVLVIYSLLYLLFPINMSSKINEKGDYLPYPGMSLISFLKHRNEYEWVNFVEFLNSLPTFNKYFRALPANSLHLTVKNFIVANSPAYRQVMANGDENQLKARVCSAFNLAPIGEVSNIYIHRSMGMIINLQNSEDIERLRTVMVTLGTGSPEPDFKYHVTFAYCFKCNVAKEDSKILENELLNIQQHITSLLKIKETILEFEPARLCYFPDMMHYVPL